MKKPLVVDLSIDFDFFIREEAEWDFKHSEANGLYHQVAWDLRYRCFDLWKETAIATYADFAPADLLAQLRQKGLKLTKRLGRLGVADSHTYAYNFYKGVALPPDVLLQVDAHHDCFGIVDHNQGLPPVNCACWMQHLMQKWFNTRFIQLYPKWKKLPGSLDGAPLDPDKPIKEQLASIMRGLGNGSDMPPQAAPNGKTVETYHFGDFPGWGDEAPVIRHLFVCRSGAWVPPHHDNAFVEFLRQLTVAWQPRIDVMQPVTRRVYPSAQDNAEMVTDINDKFAKLRELERSGELPEG